MSQGIPKSIFKTHVTIAIFLYYTLTFLITVLKVRTSGYNWMQGSGIVRDQVGKGGRHRFHISNFIIGIFELSDSHFEFQSDRDPLDKSGSG